MRIPVHERYREDPQFHMLVDMLRSWIIQNPEITPTELREAVMLAASIHEMTYVKPLLITREEASSIPGYESPFRRDHPGVYFEREEQP